jgi:hypothetical protein
MVTLQLEKFLTLLRAINTSSGFEQLTKQAQENLVMHRSRTLQDLKIVSPIISANAKNPI